MTKPLAVQLYSLRDALQTDVPGVLKRVAEMGYLGVEVFGGIPLAVPEVVSILNDLDLKVESGHFPLPFAEDAQPALTAAAAYEISYYVIPYMPPEHFATADAVKQTAERLNKANEIVKAEGYALAYHNHEFEFTRFDDGSIAFDHLLDALDPSILLEVDVYWVKVGQQRPAALVKRLGERAKLLHIKDGPANPEHRDAPMTAVGAGTVDIPAVVEASGDHAEWLVVELDHCATDMLTAVEESYNYLVERGLGHGNR